MRGQGKKERRYKGIPVTRRMMLLRWRSEGEERDEGIMLSTYCLYTESDKTIESKLIIIPEGRVFRGTG